MAELVTVPGFKGRYVIGVSWRYVERVPSLAKLRELGQTRGVWAVTYESERRHSVAGFCAPVPGVRRASTVRPLAALAAGAYTQPWMGIFDLGNDRYWLLAVRDWKQPIAGGDVVGTLTEVNAAREQLLALGDWTEYTLPFGELVEKLDRALRVPHLVDTRPRGPWLAISVVGCVIAAAGIGGMLWYESGQEADRMLARKAAAARDRAAQTRRDIVWQQHIPPWAGQPLPTDVLSRCADAWHATAIAYPGWALRGWTCSVDGRAHQSVANYSRVGGSATDAPGKLSLDGQRATLALGSAQPFARYVIGADDADRSVRAMWALVQGVNASMTLNPSTPAPPPVDKSAPVPPAWIVMPFTLKTIAPPWLLSNPEAWNGVRGARISALDYELKAGWTVRGTLNAAPADGMPADAHMPDGYPAALDDIGAVNVVPPAPVVPNLSVSSPAPVAVPAPRQAAPTSGASTPTGPVPVMPGAPRRTDAQRERLHASAAIASSVPANGASAPPSATGTSAPTAGAPGPRPSATPAADALMGIRR